MAERKVRTARWSRISRALKSAQVAEKGNFAAIDLADGALVVGGGAAQFVLGTFEDSFTGDGVRLAKVKLNAEIDVTFLGNASVGPVGDDDVGALCYLHSSWEVSMTGTGKSVAGRVWGIEPGGVWVQLSPSLGPQGPTGPAGP